MHTFLTIKLQNSPPFKTLTAMFQIWQTEGPCFEFSPSGHYFNIIPKLRPTETSTKNVTQFGCSKRYGGEAGICKSNFSRALLVLGDEDDVSFFLGQKLLKELQLSRNREAAGNVFIVQYTEKQ